MLTVLAAIVPIIGSLFVAASFLWEQGRLARERAIRRRVAVIADERYLQERDRLAAEGGHGDNSAPGKERERIEAELLRQNGIGKTHSSRGAVDIDAAMSGRLESRTELVRQWGLLGSSAAGLVLLAFGMM